MDRELFDAARDGNVGEILRILLLGADTSSKFGEYEETPLHIACHQGHSDAVRALLVAKADVDARNKNGARLCTCLPRGHTEIAQTLLQAGASLEAKDKSNNTPLIGACDGGHAEIVELLLVKGADVHAENEWGVTALCKACYNGNVEIVELLLENGADAKAKRQSTG